jgi:hypothetical protein
MKLTLPRARGLVAHDFDPEIPIYSAALTGCSLKQASNPSQSSTSPSRQYTATQAKPTAKEASSWPTAPVGAITITGEAPEAALIDAKLHPYHPVIATAACHFLEVSRTITSHHPDAGGRNPIKNHAP